MTSCAQIGRSGRLIRCLVIFCLVPLGRVTSAQTENVGESPPELQLNRFIGEPTHAIEGCRADWRDLEPDSIGSSMACPHFVAEGTTRAGFLVAYHSDSAVWGLALTYRGAGDPEVTGRYDALNAFLSAHCIDQSQPTPTHMEQRAREFLCDTRTVSIRFVDETFVVTVMDEVAYAESTSLPVALEVALSDTMYAATALSPTGRAVPVEGTPDGSAMVMAGSSEGPINVYTLCQIDLDALGVTDAGSDLVTLAQASLGGMLLGMNAELISVTPATLLDLEGWEFRFINAPESPQDRPATGRGFIFLDQRSVVALYVQAVVPSAVDGPLADRFFNSLAATRTETEDRP